MTDPHCGNLKTSTSPKGELGLPKRKTHVGQKRKEGAFAAPSSGLKGKRAVSVMFSNYPADPRPRRAAEALADEGMNVEVICLKETDEQPQHEVFNGVDVTRIPLERSRGGKLSYVRQYGMFILWVGTLLAGRTLKRRYDLVHIHNMPDVLVFSALIPKIFGAKVILDLHDPMPELMMTIFGLEGKSFAVRLLKLAEAWSIAFADAIVTVNEACRKIFSSRSCAREKITVVMNSPDEVIFRYQKISVPAVSETDSSKPFVFMYHGSLVERHGLDLAVKALGRIRKTIPNAELRVFGRSTPYLEEVLESVRIDGLGHVVQYMGPKNLNEIAKAIRDSDVGIIPNRRSIFTEINTPTRIFEYLSQGKPVIAPSAPGIMDYFGPKDLLLFELGNVEDLAAKMEYAFTHRHETFDVVFRGQAIYEECRWTIERSRFLNLVEGLSGGASQLTFAVVRSQNSRSLAQP